MEAIGGALQEWVLAAGVGLCQRDAADFLAVVGVDDATQVQGEGTQPVAQAQEREGFTQCPVVEGAQPGFGAHLAFLLQVVVGIRVPRGSAHEGARVLGQVEVGQLPLHAHLADLTRGQSGETRQVGAFGGQNGAVVARGQHEEGLGHAHHAIGWARACSSCPLSKRV